MEDQTPKEKLKEELDQYRLEPFLSRPFRRKKLLQWFIRTNIAIVLYILLWDYQWVRWSLWVYVPLNLFSIGYPLVVQGILRRKLDRTEALIERIPDEEE